MTTTENPTENPISFITLTPVPNSSKAQAKLQTNIFTNQQWQALDPVRKQMICSVAEYLDEKLPDNPSDAILSNAFHLLTAIDPDLIEPSTIRRRFAAVYFTAIQLANKELHHSLGRFFSLFLMIDLDDENYADIAIVDPDLGNCYLHEDNKSWSFDSLTDIADTVLCIRNLLIKKVTTAITQEHEVFVIVQGGEVQDIVNAPTHIHVTVLDYDTEGVEDRQLEKSPLDNLPCCLNRF